MDHTFYVHFPIHNYIWCAVMSTQVQIFSFLGTLSYYIHTSAFVLHGMSTQNNVHNSLFALY